MRSVAVRWTIHGLLACALLIGGLSLSGVARAAELDEAHQQKLLAMLEKNGYAGEFNYMQGAMLGIPTRGTPISVRKLQIYGKDNLTLSSFSRIEGSAPGYVFFFDPARDDPNSNAVAFRTDQNFKLVGAGVEWVRTKLNRLSAPKSAERFAKEIDRWVALIDAN